MSHGGGHKHSASDAEIRERMRKRESNDRTIERLRAKAEKIRPAGTPLHEMTEWVAADEITRLRTRVKELEEAMEEIREAIDIAGGGASGPIHRLQEPSPTEVTRPRDEFKE